MATRIDGSTVRHTWSTDLVIAAIRDRAQKGLALNPQVLECEDASLLAAGRRYFQSWPKALKAAHVRRPARSYTQRRPRGYWTKGRLITEIQLRAQHGQPLHAAALQRDNNSLIAAATYHFGSWSNALQASGFDADSVRRNRHHTPETVISEIRQLLQRNADLRNSVIRRHNSTLCWAARKHFGSWRRAVLCAQEQLDYVSQP